MHAKQLYSILMTFNQISLQQDDGRHGQSGVHVQRTAYKFDDGSALLTQWMTQSWAEVCHSAKDMTNRYVSARTFRRPSVVEEAADSEETVSSWIMFHILNVDISVYPCWPWEWSSSSKSLMLIYGVFMNYGVFWLPGYSKSISYSIQVELDELYLDTVILSS